MSRIAPPRELTAAEWDAYERDRIQREARAVHGGWRAPRPEDAVSHPSRRGGLALAAASGDERAAALLAAVRSHVPDIRPRTGARRVSFLATCSCGWTTSTSWRLTIDWMPAGYAWAEHDDHVRAVA